MHLDFSTQNISVAANTLTALTAIYGLVIATKGLNTWRKQLRGQTEYKLAKKIHLRTLEVRNSIMSLRSPGISPGEFTHAAEILGEEYESYENKSMAVYGVRLSRVGKAMLNLENELMVAEVLWGKDVKTLVRPLYKYFRDVSLALTKYFDPFERSGKENSDIKTLIYDSGTFDNPDEFTIRLEQEIEKIAAYLRPHLKK